MSETTVYNPLDEHLQQVDTLSEEFEVQAMLASADADQFKSFVQFFYHDLPAYRFSMLNEDFVIDRMWDAMRGRQVAFDVVLDLTSLLAATAAVQRGGWEAVARFVAKGMSIHGDQRMVKFMDAEELSEFCSESQAQQIVQDNPWLCTLFLLRLTPAYRAGLRALLDPPKPSTGHAQ
jgi:hypothetical protein